MKLSKSILGLSILIFSLTGCGLMAKDYLGETVVHIGADGSYDYRSNKNQELLKASIATDSNGRPVASIETTASTPEAAIAATAAANARMSETLNNFMNNIVPLLQNLAKQGAIAGS